MTNKLSITIITKNEEKNIERCLKSVLWADEIVVVDSGSTDKTVDICKKYKCKIIETKWLGFGKTKKLAVDSASNNWIFSIDADEEITSDLKDKIISILENPSFNAYKIKRKSFYLGTLINHSGWNKDYPLRLFNKKYGNFNDKEVHESVVINGSKSKIENYLLHYTYPSIKTHIDKMNSYSFLGAKRLFHKGKNISIFGAILRGFFKFIKMYILQLGFLDMKAGLILSINSAYGVYLKYIKLWELNNKSN